MTSGSLTGTASLASNALLLQGTGSVGFATTASLLEVSSSQQQISSSLLQVSASYISLSASYTTFSGSASTRITANSSSIQQVSSSQQQISASLLNVVANYATTGSNSFRANQSITGSLVVSSTITAQTLVVQTVTSSILYSSGSNNFGNQLANTQTFTGSVNITGSSHAIFGNVGIGIASPAEKIHVFGSSAATNPRILIQSHDTANATAGLTLYGRDVSNVNKISEIVTSGSDLTISVNSSERMRINSSGYVGIGTTNPTGSLDVSGSIYIRSTGGGVLYIPRMADQSRGLSIGEQTSLGSKSAVIRTAGGVSEHLFLDPGLNSSNVAGNIALVYANTGSVGIGTYLPTAKLEVNGTIYSTIRSATIDTDDGISNNFQGYGGYWALRTDTSNGFNLDVYGGGTPKNALNILQTTGAATFSSTVALSNFLRINASSTTSVSTSATTISTGSNTYGGLAIVWGADASGNIFTDLVFYSLSSTYVINGQSVSGSPVGRTYTCVSGDLKLAMASGTYSVRFQAIITT